MAKIFTRRGHDWTHRFKKVAHDAWRIRASSALIDGEIVVPAADGTTDFSVLQTEKGRSAKIVPVAFDLLYLNGRDLRKLPLIQRKAELRKIVDGTDVQFSESFEIEGREMFAHACKLGLEACRLEPMRVRGILRVTRVTVRADENALLYGNADVVQNPDEVVQPPMS